MFLCDSISVRKSVAPGAGGKAHGQHGELGNPLHLLGPQS